MARYPTLRITAILALMVPALVAQAPLEGRWTLVPERSESVPKAIDLAVSQVNFFLRSIARSRLTKTNPAYGRVQIRREGADQLIQFDDRAPVRSPMDGRAVPWTREDGEQFMVSTRTEGGALIQRYQAEDGRRTNTFRRGPDGLLHLEVLMESPRLPAPLHYTLVFRSAP